MKIYCKRCSTHLGEIISGSRLKKDIAYHCGECTTKLEIAESAMKTRGIGSNDKMDDLFRSMGWGL